MKRVREVNFDATEDESQHKKYKPSTCFPDVLEQIILNYTIDNPLDEFFNACIINNKELAEWIFAKFKLEKEDKKTITEKYECQMLLAQDIQTFYWCAEKLQIKPNYESMVSLIALSNSNYIISKDLTLTTFGNDISKYRQILITVMNTNNVNLFTEITKIVPADLFQSEFTNAIQSNRVSFTCAKIARIVYEKLQCGFTSEFSNLLLSTIKNSCGYSSHPDEAEKIIDLFEKEMWEYERITTYGEYSYVIELCKIKNIRPNIMIKMVRKVSDQWRLKERILRRDPDMTSYVNSLNEPDRTRVIYAFINEYDYHAVNDAYSIGLIKKWPNHY